eukprot:TCALIF_06563-PA protein Name:"Protein of unknown function" AED:0.26 eAED:0.26 QI:0/0/0.5/0.5/0/1/2/20/133
MDAFKQSQDPIWQKAWKDRIEPYLSSYSNAFVCLLLGLIIGSVFLAMERSSHGLSQITGLSFNWLHSYGQEDPDKEDLEILNDDTINVKAKRAIQSKTQRIQDLEELVVKLTAVNTQSVESNQGFIYADEKKN